MERTDTGIDETRLAGEAGCEIYGDLWYYFFYFYICLKLNLIKVFVKKKNKKRMDPSFLSVGRGPKALLKSVAEVKLGTALPRLIFQGRAEGGGAHALLLERRGSAGEAAERQDQNAGVSTKGRHNLPWWDRQSGAYRKQRKIWYIT